MRWEGLGSMDVECCGANVFFSLRRHRVIIADLVPKKQVCFLMLIYIYTYPISSAVELMPRWVFQPRCFRSGLMDLH